MKGLSSLLFVLGIAMVVNAIGGEWAFDFSQKGGTWVAVDLLVAGGCFLGWKLSRDYATQREAQRLMHEDGSLNGALRRVDPSA